MSKAKRNNQLAVNEGVQRLQAGHHPQAWVKGFKPFWTNTPAAAPDRWQKYVGLGWVTFGCVVFLLFPLFTFGELFSLLAMQNFALGAVAQSLTQLQVARLIGSVLICLVVMKIQWETWRGLFKAKHKSE